MASSSARFGQLPQELSWIIFADRRGRSQSNTAAKPYHPLAVGDEGPIRILRIHGFKAGSQHQHQHRVGAGESIDFVGRNHRFGVPPAEAELGAFWYGEPP